MYGRKHIVLLCFKDPKDLECNFQVKAISTDDIEIIFSVSTAQSHDRRALTTQTLSSGQNIMTFAHDQPERIENNSNHLSISMET